MVGPIFVDSLSVTQAHTHTHTHTSRTHANGVSVVCPPMLVISKIVSPVLFPDLITRHANYPTGCLSCHTTLKPAHDANPLHFL